MMRRGSLLKLTLSTLAVTIVLSGCVLIRSTPTPLPWIPTATPTVQVTSQTLPENTTAPTPVLTTSTPQPGDSKVTPTLEVSSQTISVLAPLADARVNNPLHIAGNVSIMPFEGTLLIRVYDVNDALAAVVPIIAEGEYGGPGTFDAEIVYGGNPGPGRLEILDISPKDGSIIAKAEVPIQLGGFPGEGVIEMPGTQESVTLPIRLLARVGNPGQVVNITLLWQDGSQFVQSVEALPGQDGRGLVITTLEMPGHIAQPPPTQPAQISITSVDGSPLAMQPITVLQPGDPDTMTIKVYWVLGDAVVADSVAIPETVGVGRASLNLLLWGPAPQNAMGYTSAIPSPKEVLLSQERTNAWGEYVRLNNLSITDGVATADFSGELLAHSGGAAQIELIRQQIESTLLQFSTVNSVVITVDGNPDRLQP